MSDYKTVNNVKEAFAQMKLDKNIKYWYVRCWKEGKKGGKWCFKGGDNNCKILCPIVDIKDCYELLKIEFLKRIAPTNY